MKAFKFRIYPNLRQRRQLSKDIGCARYVYNWGIDRRREHYAESGKHFSTAELSRLLTKTKDSLSFLQGASSTVLVNSLWALDEAYGRFFKKLARYPRRKSRRSKRSSSYQMDKRRGDKIFIDGQKLVLPRLGPMRVVWSKSVPAMPNSVTVSQEADGSWYASLQVDCKCTVDAPPSCQEIGLDLGLTDFVTTSDGDKIKPLRPYRNGRAKIKKLARHMCRKKKGSKNRQKARKKLGKTQVRIARQRRDFLHQTSTSIVRRHRLIAIEDLSVSGMMANGKLAQSIGDAGWYEFRRQLEYKCAWYRRDLVVIGRFEPTSKTCSCCGHKLDELSLSERSWRCPSCGTVHDRDVNAARNILNTARSAGRACGADGRPKA